MCYSVKKIHCFHLNSKLSTIINDQVTITPKRWNPTVTLIRGLPKGRRERGRKRHKFSFLFLALSSLFSFLISSFFPIPPFLPLKPSYSRKSGYEIAEPNIECHIREVFPCNKCRSKGYGFSAILVINSVSILAITRVWFLHFSLELTIIFVRDVFIILVR